MSTSAEVPEFFMPAATDTEQAEQGYRAIAKFNGAAVGDERIFALEWRHNGINMACRVGEPLPSSYQTGSEPVLAILDAGSYYAICTPNRGGLRGGPVMAGKGSDTCPTYFKRGG